VCRPSHRRIAEKAYSYCAILTPSIEVRTHELDSRPLDELGDNLASDPIGGFFIRSPPNRSVYLDRISLVWAGDDRMRGRGFVLYEHHRRAVCRPVTLR
jgi:hypothetical protein